MKVGDTVRICVTDTNEGGRGIGRSDGCVVFVPSLLTGDEADVIITEVKKNYAVGKAVRITENSPYRISPVCRESEKCGGCSLSHVSTEYENEIKRNTVKNALRRAGLSGDIVKETFLPSSRTGYRNKVTLHFDAKKKTLGLYGEETNEVVPFKGCALLPESFNEIGAYLAENTEMLSSAQTDEVILKLTDGEKTAVIVKCAGDVTPLAKSLTERFDSIVSVTDADSSEDVYVYGEYGKLRMRFSALAFRQVNDSAFASLLSLVVGIVREEPFESCADLYCGSGVIGLTLAMEHPEKQFYGIEINEDSIRDAKNNALDNGIENITFYSGDAASFRENIPKEKLPDIVVVDPPRAGLSDKMKGELVSLEPTRIIYVSCNPQTLARDIKYFTENGYSLRSVTPVNMFPMTKHVETVVLMSRDKE